MFCDYLLLIGSIDVTGYLRELTCDQTIGQNTAESQKFSCAIANLDGMFYDVWKKNDKIVCYLFRVDEDLIEQADGTYSVSRTWRDNYGNEIGVINSLGVSPSNYTLRNASTVSNKLTMQLVDSDGKVVADMNKVEPLFTGEVQDVRPEQIVTINGSCDSAKMASNLLKTEAMKPIDATAKAWAERVCKQQGIELDWFSDEPNPSPVPLGGMSQSVITTGLDGVDSASDLAGGVWYVDEWGKVKISRMYPKATKLSLDGLIKNPANAVNAIGYCNKVRVMSNHRQVANGAAQSILSPTNSETPTSDLNVVYPDDPNSEDWKLAEYEKYGVLMAPTRVENNLTTHEEVYNRAKQLYKSYRTFKDVVNVDVVGISPPLRVYVNYNVYYWVGEDQTPQMHEVLGTVKRKQTKYDSSGWTCTISVATQISLEKLQSAGLEPGYYNTVFGPMQFKVTQILKVDGKTGGFFVPKTIGAGFLFVNDTGYADMLKLAGISSVPSDKILLYNPKTNEATLVDVGDLRNYQGYYEVINPPLQNMFGWNSLTNLTAYQAQTAMQYSRRTR